MTGDLSSHFLKLLLVILKVPGTIAYYLVPQLEVHSVDAVLQRNFQDHLFLFKDLLLLIAKLLQ